MCRESSTAAQSNSQHRSSRKENGVVRHGQPMAYLVGSLFAVFLWQTAPIMPI
jgi:hypothetical protein